MFTQQYYILVRSPYFERVFNWIFDHDIPYELHANRIRFRPHTSELLLEFLLRYESHCSTVESPYPSVF
jgi:hypothetical protein